MDQEARLIANQFRRELSYLHLILSPLTSKFDKRDRSIYHDNSNLFGAIWYQTLVDMCKTVHCCFKRNLG